MESPTILHAILPSVPPYVSYSWLAMGILIGLAAYLRNKIELLPGGLQNVMEVLADFFLNLSNSVIGHHWGDKFYPLIGTLGLYIGLCNLPTIKFNLGFLNTFSKLLRP
ncbi:MAG: F0F1 ATP synthase subunit A, partial [Thermodesulfovibrionales bacterium]|nr:F0F1 ATP synthase subunit A [Thermodesulfovibrionales bacterium]